MARTFGEEYDSIDEARRDLKNGDRSIIKLQDGDLFKVRIIHEPFKKDGRPGWLKYMEHFNDEFKFFPCTGDEECPGCEEGKKPSTKYLVAAYDTSANKIVVFQFPIGLAKIFLESKFKRNGTVMDRDYELSREGSGLTDTRYEVEGLPVSKRPRVLNMAIPNLNAALRKSVTSEFLDYIGDEAEDDDEGDYEDPDVEEDDDDDDEEEERPRRRSKTSSSKSRPAPARRRSRDEDEEDEDDEPPARRRIARKSTARTETKKRRPLRRG